MRAGNLVTIAYLHESIPTGTLSIQVPTARMTNTVTAFAEDPIDTLQRELATLAAARDRDRRALDILHDVSVACLGQTSSRAIFEAIHQSLATVFHYDAAYIAICNPQPSETFYAALLYDEGQFDFLENTPYGPLTGLLIHTRAPLLVRDLAQERRTLGIEPEQFGDPEKQSRSWLGVPMLLGPETVGVISLQSYQPAVYTNDHLDLLRRIGNLLAVALENAALAGRQRALSDELAARVAARTRELATLAALTEELVLQRPLSELLDRALMLVVEQLGMTGGAVRLLVDELNELVLAASYGFPPEYSQGLGRVPVADSIVGRVITERRPVVMNNVTRSEHWERLGLHYRALMSVPLQIGERVLGALTLVDAQERAIAEQEVEFARMIGHQIAIAVENARLFAERERQVAELSALSDISQAASTTLELRALLRHVARALARFMRADVFSIVAYDPEQQLIRDGLTIDAGEEYTYWQREPPPPDSLTAWVLRQRRPLHFGNLTEEISRYPDLGWHVVGAERPAVSWLGVPLLGRDDMTLGVLAVQGYTRNAFDARDQRFLTAVARQLALHVQNVVLFAAEREARRTADTLREVARVLSVAFNSGEVLSVILRELNKLIPYDSATIMLLEGNTLRVAAVAGWDGIAPQEFVHHQLNEPSAAVWVMHQKQPLLINDVAISPLWRHDPRIDSIRAWLGVPLIARGTVLGVLNIDAGQPGHFSQRDAEVAQVFAGSAAVAIENARLYAESIARREQELEIARRIQANLFPRELPRRPGVTLSARCLPAREVGGDFFDCFSLGERRATAVMIGDASGKSVPGALLMAIARSVGRAEAIDHEEPALVLRETNRSVAHDVPRGTFVALCYATLEPTGQLTVANAGQLTPILLRPDGAITYLYPPGPTLPLGILPDIPYEALRIDLTAGDVVLFFTDGLVEAQNTRGTLFGFERLDALLTAHANHDPDTLIERIIAEVTTFMDEAPQHDDITLVALRREAG